MSKRILMINDHVHFSGGGDAVFRQERAVYERLGHQVYTFSQSPDPSPDRRTEDFVFQESTNRFVVKGRKYLGSPAISRALADVLREVQPDLVRVHLVSKYPLSVYRALGQARKPDCPVVQTLHGPNLFCATSWGNLRKDSQPCQMGFGKKCFECGCISRASYPLYRQFFSRLTGQLKDAIDTYLCPSEFIQRAADHAGLANTRYFPYGIDALFSEPLTNVIPFEEPSLLFVGSLVEPKGVRYMIEAMPTILDAIPNAVLRICGRGPLMEDLQARTLSLGVAAQVQFLGFTERPELLQLYRKSSCLVVPSIWAEQFGLIGPESLACGTPVVATDVGGIPEWLRDGKSGYLVPPRHPAAIADKVIQILQSPERSREFAQFGRTDILSRFSHEVYEANMCQLLDELL